MPARTWFEAALPLTLAMFDEDRNWKSSVTRGKAGSEAPVGGVVGADQVVVRDVLADQQQVGDAAAGRGRT